MPISKADLPASPPLAISNEAVWEEVARVSASKGFARSERLRRFLRFVVEATLTGQPGDLKEYPIGVQVFDRGDSFDPRVDSIVRSEARRLRTRLDEYYAAEGLLNPLRIQIPPGNYIPIFEPATPPLVPGDPQPPVRSVRSWLLPTAALLTLAAALALGWVIGSRGGTPAQQWKFTPLTNDGQLAFQPALSRDGSMVAYASNRAETDNFDIWFQIVGRGEPLRLTTDPAHDFEPSLSPSGDRVVFRSHRQGGGLFAMPTIGGRLTRISERGRNPRFSPNGDEIAFWDGEPFARSGQLYIVPATGGDPRPVAADFANARYPVWSPSGEQIAFLGAEKLSERIDLWILDRTSGESHATGILAEVRERGLFDATSQPLGPWLDSGEILLAARDRSHWSLWRADLSDSAKLSRVSAGLGQAAFPGAAAADGAFVFAAETRHHIAATIDLDDPAAPPSRLIDGGAQLAPRVHPHLPLLLYETPSTQSFQVRLRHLATGEDVALSDTPSDAHHGIFSPDGARVAFQRFRQTAPHAPVYVTSIGGQEAIETADVRGALMDWSPDGNSLLIAGKHLEAVPLDGSEPIPLATNTRAWHARFAPDGQYLAFQELTPDRAKSQIFVASATAETPRDAWLPLASGLPSEQRPAWAPDASELYFLAHDGVALGLYARAWDGQRFTGPVRHIYTEPGAHATLAEEPISATLSATGRQLVFSTVERRAEVWLATSAP